MLDARMNWEIFCSKLTLFELSPWCGINLVLPNDSVFVCVCIYVDGDGTSFSCLHALLSSHSWYPQALALTIKGLDNLPIGANYCCMVSLDGWLFYFALCQLGCESKVVLCKWLWCKSKCKNYELKVCESSSWLHECIVPQGCPGWWCLRVK